MIDYLNQDHPVLRDSKGKLSYAVGEVLDRALELSSLFRLQFDRKRLERVIGAERLRRLMPDLKEGSSSTWSYDVYEGVLDQEQKNILRDIFTVTGEGFPERPLNYIRSVRLLDNNRRTVLRGGDRNQFVLFALPDAARAQLIEALTRNDIPAEAIEQVDVDLEKLDP
jgi:hypothetical protein